MQKCRARPSLSHRAAHFLLRRAAALRVGHALCIRVGRALVPLLFFFFFFAFPVLSPVPVVQMESTEELRRSVGL